MDATSDTTLYYATTTPITFTIPEGTAASTVFKLSIRETKDPSTTSMCDATGTVAEGVATFSADTFNSTFLDVSLRAAKAWLEIYADGIVFIQRQIPISCRAGSIDGMPPEPIVLYYTKAEADALLAAKMPNVTGSTVGQVLVWGGTSWIPGSAAVQDVTVNGESVVSGGTASIDLTGYQTKIDSTNKLPYAYLSGTPELAEVATSGDYDDLSNKPTIPGTAADVGALALTGGTLSGGLTAAGDIITTLDGQTVSLSSLPMVIIDGGTVTAATIANVEGGKDYQFGTLASLTVTAVTNSDRESIIEFTSGGTATILNMPSTLLWQGGELPSIEANMTYAISIQNNLAVCAGFKAVTE